MIHRIRKKEGGTATVTGKVRAEDGGRQCGSNTGSNYSDSWLLEEMTVLVDFSFLSRFYRWFNLPRVLHIKIDFAETNFYIAIFFYKQTNFIVWSIFVYSEKRISLITGCSRMT